MIKDPHFEVVGVVTQPDRPAGRKLQLQPSPVKAMVQPLGIPVLTPEDINHDDVLAAIAEFKAEVVVVVAFGQILKKKLLGMFPDRVVNVHASLLPRWRGAAPIQRALMAGDSETGVSLQVMVRKLDAGPVLGERRFPLASDMSAFDSYRMCEQLGAQLLQVDLMDYLRGNLTPVPQDEALVTLAPKIEKSEGSIDWSQPAETVHNRVRGLAMGPVAYTLYQGKMLKIHKTRPNTAHNSARQPGEVLKATEKTLLVHCGKGSLELLIVQPESRSQIQIDEFLRGYPVKVGDRLGERPSADASKKTPAT